MLNQVPKIERTIFKSNIDQFLKFMTFLKSEFCGLHKNDLKCYPMCFGGREIAKKTKCPKY